MDVESHVYAVNDMTDLQTLNSTNPAQNYKVSQVSKSQTALTRHNFETLELWYILISFPDYQVLRLYSAICLEVFSDLDIVRRLNCEHVFHRQCIDLWLQRQRVDCPLCKSVYIARSEGNLDVQRAQVNEMRNSEGEGS